MILSPLPDHARIWIYQANRVLTSDEVQKVDAYMQRFVQSWAAHGAALEAGAEVLDNRWLVLALNEEVTGASGCSIDSSVHAVKEIGDQLGIDFFNRTIVWWKDGEEIKSEPMHDFWARRKAKLIADDTPVFNALAKDLGTLRNSAFVSFSESWHAEMW